MGVPAIAGLQTRLAGEPVAGAALVQRLEVAQALGDATVADFMNVADAAAVNARNAVREPLANDSREFFLAASGAAAVSDGLGDCVVLERLAPHFGEAPATAADLCNEVGVVEAVEYP